MSSRKKIIKFCKDNDIVILEMNYVRDYVPVPEEMVPVGWVMYVHPASNPDDVFEFTGYYEDIISQLGDLVDYDKYVEDRS